MIPRMGRRWPSGVHRSCSSLNPSAVAATSLALPVEEAKQEFSLVRGGNDRPWRREAHGQDVGGNPGLGVDESNVCSIE
jgi:hypothetical protein